MAERRRYLCSACRVQVEAWSDGYPCFIDERGEKKYAYHPDPAIEQCVGNDVPSLCLRCGTDFMVGARTPSLTARAATRMRHVPPTSW